MSKYEITSLIFSALTFSAAVIVAVIYGCMLIEMQKSTNAATKAAKAAEDSVTLARENAHLDQRAWVDITDISGFPEAGKPFIVTIQVNNVGKTFAKNLKGSPIIDPRPIGEVPDFAAKVAEVEEKNKGRSDVVVSSALLPPNGRVTGTIKASDGNISQQAFDNVKANQIRIFLYGRVTYEDIFNSKHWTTYCSVLLPRTTGGWDWAVYERFNDYGDENPQ